MSNLFDLTGKVAAVVGGGGVLAGEMALGLAKAGADIAVLDFNPAAAEARANEVRSFGRKAVGVAIDATKKADLDKALTQILAELGGVHILINAAGVNSGTPFLEITEEEWHRLLDVDLKSVFLACQVFGAHMTQPGNGGSIINISSISSGPPLSKVFTYSVAKGGVNQITQFLAREWAQQGVRVNAILPGFFPAEQNRKLLTEERTASIMTHTPMKRFGDPRELVGTAIFLSSDAASSFVTGAIIRVDGGYSAMTIRSMTPLERLEEQKRAFGPGQAAEVLRLIGQLEKRRLPDTRALARYHEALLFFRAYPADRAVAEAAEGALSRIAERVARLDDSTPLEEPESSGIAGCSITAVFSGGVVRHLRARYPGRVNLALDAWDEPKRLAHVLPSLAPEFADDGAVESDVPFRDWLDAAGGFPRLLEDEQLYDQLEAPITFDYASTPASRTTMRIRQGPVFYHDAPLIPRRDVSLDAIESAAPIPFRTLPPSAARRVIAAAIETSAVRYRELHGFTYGDPGSVREYRAGRGVVFYLWDVLPERRLPLRAYQAVTMWKNGVPFGYFEGLSICDRMEAGFNLYYTFRDGETAWLYSRLLTVLHQAAGVRYFWLHPYQIGHDNEEAIASGAFWFYRKLGFRPVDPSIRELTGREEHRLARDPSYRTPPATLRRLVRRPMIYSLPSADPAVWDDFEARRVTLAAARAGSLAKGLPPFGDVAPAKRSLRELDFLRLTQQHPRLKGALLRVAAR